MGGHMARKKMATIEAGNSEYMTIRQFQTEIIPWSIDTIKTYVELEQLPAIPSRNGLVFERKAVREWFKRRETQAS